MKNMIKCFASLTAVAVLATTVPIVSSAADPAQGDNSFDASMVFATETQLNVYVDGQWSDKFSRSFGFGDTVTITAPSSSGGKSFSHWKADGSIISYNRTLKMTMNAHTKLYAVYAGSAASKPTAGFTSITRTSDGKKISFQAIADSQAASAGIVYSATATGNNLKIGGTGVTNVEAVQLTDNASDMPKSILDKNKCWMLQITPDKASTVYHARAYVIIDGTTTYGDVKNVKLSELENGVSMIANLDGFDPENSLNSLLQDLTSDMKTVTYHANGGTGTMSTQAVLSGKATPLSKNVFTREGFTFAGWSTSPNGGIAYQDGEKVTLSQATTLYAKWETLPSALKTKPTAKNPTYYSSAVQLINAGTVEDGCKIEYASGQNAITVPESGWTEEASSITADKAGTFYVWYRVTGDADHTGVDATPIAVSVYSAANAVDNLIADIGTAAYTDACKEKIDKAVNAYEKLTADEKKLVTKSDDLTKAKNAYAALEAVSAVTEKIENIGDVENTDECKKRIDDAKSAYNALNADQKKLVKNDTALTYAEKLYNALAGRKEAEDTAAQALADKSAAEAAQKTAETKQAAAEKALAESEKAAKDAAEKAAAAEAAQKAAEEARKKGETDAAAKVTAAEAAQKAAEEAQATAEQSAKDAEAKVTAAEKALKTAEEKQAVAEKAAEEAEKKAAAAETAQKAAEDALEKVETDASERIAAAEAAQKAAEEAKAAAEKVAQEATDKAVAAAVAQAAAEEALANGEKDAAEKVAAAEAAQKAAEAAKSAAEQSAKEAADKAEAAEAVQKTLEDALAKAEREAADRIANAEAKQKTAEKAQAAAEKSEKDALEKAAAAESARKAAEEAIANGDTDAAEKVAAAEAAQKAAEEAAVKAESDKVVAEQTAQNAAGAQKDAEAAAEQAEADRIAAETAKAEAERKAAEMKAAADREAADKVMSRIDAIGRVKKTDDCRNSIVGARATYEMLTEEQQSLVTNLDVLESAEKKYDALPQTGYSGLYKAVAAVAALLGITGAVLVKKSRKEDEE